MPQDWPESGSVSRLLSINNPRPGVTVIVSFSLPEHICAALAAEAGRMRRSRSFIVAEAVTQYLAGRQ